MQRSRTHAKVLYSDKGIIHWCRYAVHDELLKCSREQIVNKVYDLSYLSTNLPTAPDKNTVYKIMLFMQFLL